MKPSQDRLGLPDKQTAEIVEDMTRKMPRFLTCPHCGGILTESDALEA